MRDIEKSFKEKLYECNRHCQKIEDAKEYLSNIIPLTSDSYAKIDKITSSFIDQLIFRFSKLQDSVGEYVLRNILILEKEDVKKLTFLDILNRFEELELLKKDEWLKLRELRNEIAHEYSFNQEEVVENINLIYEKSDDLVDIYKRLSSYVEKKFGITS